MGVDALVEVTLGTTRCLSYKGFTNDGRKTLKGIVYWSLLVYLKREEETSSGSPTAVLDFEEEGFDRPRTSLSTVCLKEFSLGTENLRNLKSSPTQD